MTRQKRKGPKEHVYSGSDRAQARRQATSPHADVRVFEKGQRSATIGQCQRKYTGSHCVSSEDKRLAERQERREELANGLCVRSRENVTKSTGDVKIPHPIYAVDFIINTF